MILPHLTGPDFEALVTGTVIEENAEVALELSQRWEAIIKDGGCHVLTLEGLNSQM